MSDFSLQALSEVPQQPPTAPTVDQAPWRDQSGQYSSGPVSNQAALPMYYPSSGQPTNPPPMQPATPYPAYPPPYYK